jgi:hypothetical protein
MPVVSFGNTLTTSAPEDASRENGASLFFTVSCRGLALGFCCVLSVQLDRGLYYLLRPVWLCSLCGCGLCRRLLWCFFIGVVYFGLRNEAYISLRSQVYVLLHPSWRLSSPKSVNCALVNLEFEIRGVYFRVLWGHVCDKWPDALHMWHITGCRSKATFALCPAMNNGEGICRFISIYTTHLSLALL